MFQFPVHTMDSASDEGKAALAVSKKSYGNIPNLHGVMAGSPSLLESYQALNKLFMNNSLTNVERNIVWLTVNYENDCHYCMAAHSMIAKMSGVDDTDIKALRTGAELAEPELQTLRRFTAHMVQTRGWPEAAEMNAMEKAGYTAQTALDVILAIGMKTLSNYTNHLADTPLDSAFEPFIWEKPAQVNTITDQTR